MPVLPLSGFRSLDDEFVFVESLVGEQRLDDPEEIAPIVRAFDALRDAAVDGLTHQDITAAVSTLVELCPVPPGRS